MIQNNIKEMKVTESPSLYDNLDKKTVNELLIGMNDQDKTVPESVSEVIPLIEYDFIDSKSFKLYKNISLSKIRILSFGRHWIFGFENV